MGPLDKVPGVRAAAQEGKIGGDGKFDITTLESHAL
jgi:hypothetical protein